MDGQRWIGRAAIAAPTVNVFGYHDKIQDDTGSAIREVLGSGHEEGACGWQEGQGGGRFRHAARC